jgi:hypothetical protein
MERLRTTLAQTRYLQFANPSPVNGPHALHDGDTGIVYNMWAFGRLIRERSSSNHSLPVIPIETIEFDLLNDDRLRTYQRIAKLTFPDSFRGVSSVIISSLENAPDLFDLLSDDVFPGQLTSMKNVTIDVSIRERVRAVPNVSSAYTSPHLQSITFRLHGLTTGDIANRGSLGDSAAPFTQEGEDGESDLGAKDLAEPFRGSSTRLTFIAAPGQGELSELCTQATAHLNGEGSR